MRNPTTLKKLIGELKAYSENELGGITSFRSAHKMTESAYKMMEIRDENFLHPIGDRGISADQANSPRQQVPTTYSPNGYLDILKTENVIKNRFLHGDRVKLLETKYSPELDVPKDLQYVRWVLNDDPGIEQELFNE